MPVKCQYGEVVSSEVGFVDALNTLSSKTDKFCFRNTITATSNEVLCRDSLKDCCKLAVIHSSLGRKSYVKLAGTPEVRRFHLQNTIQHLLI